MAKKKIIAQIENVQGTIQPKNFPPLPSHWKTDWETFQSTDQRHQVYCVTHHVEPWTKDSVQKNPKTSRALVVAHGLGEHSGRYLHLPHFLKETVGAVHLIDHLGHGRSEGLRGHIDTFDRYAEDLILAITRLDEKMRSELRSSEIHLLGHSMGGLIVLRALLKNTKLPIQSVTLSAPLLAPFQKVPPVKRAGGFLLSKVWGSFHLSSDLNPEHVSHDPAVVHSYISDRMVHSKVTPRFFFSLEKAMADTLSGNGNIAYPILMLLPGQDLIVKSDVALKYFQQLKVRDKSLINYPDFYHETFNEPKKEMAFKDLIHWIETHSSLTGAERESNKTREEIDK